MHKKHLFIIYLVFLHLLLVIVLLKSNFINKIESQLGIQPDISNNYYRTMVGFHSRIDKNIPNGAILFFGDSHIQGLAVSAISPLSVNYGIGGDTTSELLQRLPVYKSLHMAKSLVLAIGYNDLKRRSDSDITNNIKNILRHLSSERKIILCAINLIDESKLNKKNMNQRITLLNSNLEKMSRKNNKVTFLNINNFIAIKGNLAAKYHIGDGVHLNKLGYDVWIQHLKHTLDSKL